MAEASVIDASIFGVAPPGGVSHSPQGISAGMGDPDGYLEIAIGGDVILKIPAAAETVKLRVSSHVLCTTSPVFRAMLGPNSQFKEASELRMRSAENPYELSLEDDYPYTLTAVLLALHGRSEMVPVDPSFRNLLELAIVCDKYDCRGGVLSWVDIWAAAWKPRMLESGYEEWLFVAWVFGIEEGFDKLSRKVILESYIDPADGKLRSAGGVRLEELIMPEGLLDFITAERASTIAMIIPKKDDILLKYTSTWEQGTLCKAQPPLEECDALVLGSIMKSLESSKPVTELQRMSVFGLRNEISHLRLAFLHTFKCSNYSCERVPASYSEAANPCQCRGTRAKDFKGSHESHSTTCSPMPSLLALIDGIISSVSGMDLEASGRIPMKGPNFKWEGAGIREPAAYTSEIRRAKGKAPRMSGLFKSTGSLS